MWVGPLRETELNYSYRWGQIVIYEALSGFHNQAAAHPAAGQPLAFLPPATDGDLYRIGNPEPKFLKRMNEEGQLQGRRVSRDRQDDVGGQASNLEPFFLQRARMEAERAEMENPRSFSRSQSRDSGVISPEQRFGSQPIYSLPRQNSGSGSIPVLQVSMDEMDEVDLIYQVGH